MKSRRDLSSEQKIVAEGFIGNIARVIRRERVKKNLSQEDLASMVGVDRSMISNYENEKADITASLMANISVVCEFPMDEYVKITGLLYDDSQPVDVLFKKLVASSGQEMESAARIDDGLPKKPKLIFNRENGSGRWIILGRFLIPQGKASFLCPRLLALKMTDCLMNI